MSSRTPVTIAIASAEDAVALAALHHLSHTTSFAPFASDEWLAGRDEAEYVAQWQSFFERATKDRRFRAWKATSGNKLVGMVKVGPENETEAQLTSMHVRPTFRRQGIGSSLMADAVSFMRSEGFRTAMLGVIQANAPARAIYEKHGWTVRELRPTGVEGVPVAIYELDLKA